VDLKLWFWGKVYQRKDVDNVAYRSYLRAEDELMEKLRNRDRLEATR